MAPIVYMVLWQTFIVFVSWCWQLAPIDLLCVGLFIILQVLWSSDGWDGVSVDTRTHATEGLRCSGASHRALAWSQGQIWVLGNAEDRTQALPRCRRCSMLASHTSHTSTKLHSFRSVFAASGLMQGSLAGRPGARKHRNRVKMTPVASLRETIESEGQGWN